MYMTSKKILPQIIYFNNPISQNNMSFNLALLTKPLDHFGKDFGRHGFSFHSLFRDNDARDEI